MPKIILQLIITIATFFASYFRKKIAKRFTIIIAISIVVFFIMNSIIIFCDDKRQRQEQANLKKEISKISLKSERQESKINDLLTSNQNLESRIEQQTEEIRVLNNNISELTKLLANFIDKELKQTKSYAEAKNLFDSANELMIQGNNKVAAEKLLKLRELALKEQAYESAAISSLLASFRFEEMGEKQKAAELQSEAGSLFLKLK